MDNRQKIIKAFTEGNFPGSDSQHPKHISTAISDVFITDNKAYKIYKKDNLHFNKHFNDISIKKNRFAFTCDDFTWNNDLNPKIYTNLIGILWKNNNIIFSEPENEADELLIVMNKFEDSDLLTNRLLKNKISLQNCYKIGYQLAQKIKGLKIKPVKCEVYEDFVSRYRDEVAWFAGVKKHIPEKEAKIYLNLLKNLIKKHKNDFENKSGLIGLCLDIHSDNVIFDNNNFYPIDTYSPKKAWLYGYKFISVFRLATDIYVFLGIDAFEEVLKGYQKFSREKIPREFDKLLILYSEIIACPYQYMLSEKDPSRLEVAKKHHTFLRKIAS